LSLNQRDCEERRRQSADAAIAGRSVFCLVDIEREAERLAKNSRRSSPLSAQVWNLSCDRLLKGSVGDGTCGERTIIQTPARPKARLRLRISNRRLSSS
jgi:hypothetical protein